MLLTCVVFQQQKRATPVSVERHREPEVPPFIPVTSGLAESAGARERLRLGLAMGPLHGKSRSGCPLRLSLMLARQRNLPAKQTAPLGGPKGRGLRETLDAFSSEVGTGSHSNQAYADCVDLSAVENASEQEAVRTRIQCIGSDSIRTYDALVLLASFGRTAP
jgi:hypothetical protein